MYKTFGYTVALIATVFVLTGCTPSRPVQAPARPIAPVSAPRAPEAPRPPILPPQTSPPSAVSTKPCLLTANLVKQRCAINGELIQTQAFGAVCQFSLRKPDGKAGDAVISYNFTPWKPDIRNLVETGFGAFGALGRRAKSWDVPNLGDLAFQAQTVPSPNEGKESLERDGSYLFVKQGDQLHQFTTFFLNQTKCNPTEAITIAKEALR